MSEFKKWFAARARNPDRITLEEAFAAGARSQPAPSEEARLVSYHPDGDTCTLNINGVEMYYDRVDRDTQPAPSVPEVAEGIKAAMFAAQAQPAPSVPCGWIQRGMAELAAIRNRLDDDTLLDDRTLIERIGKAMLAAAPEAQP